MVRLAGCYALALGTLLVLIAPSTAQSCGIRKAANTLVWKGQEAKDGFWPWHVALWRSTGGTISYFCGGTILDNNVVLTAAHCLQTPLGPISREQITVQVGRNRLKLADDRTKEHEVDQVFIHQDYTSNTVTGDIALIKLATDITYTNFIQPICLWSDGLPSIVGRRGFVVGFGIDESNRPPGSLREAQLPVVDNFQCVKSNPGFFSQTLTEKMFCGGDRNGTSACNGDSGGGLFFQFGETWYIRGIVSYTQSRQIDGADYLVCDPHEYTVFTDVSKYLDWIAPYLRKAGGVATLPPPVDNSPKLNLLSLDTCGSNAYPYQEESSKPVFLGYPWVGLLEYTETGAREKKTLCHATLISDRYLITAAHCIVNLPPRYKLSTVRLGEYDKTTNNDCGVIDGSTVCAPPVQTLRIESVIAHKSFNTPKFANDIALVRLRDRADVSKRNVKPICLPFSKELRSFKPSVFTLTAWEAGSSAAKIERSERGVVDTVECQQKYTEESIALEKSFREICVLQQAATGSRCKFPASAAPLQAVQNVRGTQRYVLHGMLSYGPKTCSTSFPDVYVNVGSFMEWILTAGTVRGFLAALLVVTVVFLASANAETLSCGERKVKTVYLVQHGTETKEGHWPWHTAIYHREGKEFNYACGGSILDRNTILTAAHCLYNQRGALVKLDELSVQLGRNQLSEASPSSQEHVPLELIVHPDHNRNSVANDIALIKLATEITMTNYIQPVCLWNMEPDQKLIAGKNGTVVGFGLTEHDRVSDYLRQAQITVVDTWTCIESDRAVYGNSLTSSMFCGGGRKGVSACNGDSGGGMFFELAETWYVRGIVSFMPLRENVGLCDGTKYTVFTDVAKYREWIEMYITPTSASVPTDPLLVDNSPKLRLLNFNKCGISVNLTGSSNDSFLTNPWVGLVEVIPRGQNRSQVLCHVTLISEWYVLGPAHCFINDGQVRTIRLGDYDTSTDTDCVERQGTTVCAPPLQRLPIQTIHIRPDYNRISITDDIALVQLQQPADMTQPNVRPICLPVTLAQRSYKPENFTLAGFPTEDGTVVAESNPTYLNSVNCQQRFNEIGFPLRKSYTQTCANGLPANHTGPCIRIMSGAPLQTVQTFGRRERRFLQGILSFGSRECDPTVPDIYTNVASYLEWILYNMKDIKVNALDTRDRLVFTN
ncbi:transmembrane protease serine 9-like [Anopheles coustani]|uniref:transmembrane protease serine 9-like n=1 Tax=Anopheles coustani TaxID=139045 RepID=UPI0026587A53|nr:transmembrane protease serine 9-like [Anopheles coustani]